MLDGRAHGRCPSWTPDLSSDFCNTAAFLVCFTNTTNSMSARLYLHILLTGEKAKKVCDTRPERTVNVRNGFRKLPNSGVVGLQLHIYQLRGYRMN